MFLNIASGDGCGVPTTNKPSKKFSVFFAKPSSTTSTNCFKDFLDDIDLTHAVYLGIIAAPYLS